MGKGSKKRVRIPGKSSKALTQNNDACFMDEDMNDEIDTFHKQREMIPLDVSKDAGESDDDLDEPVFDLEGSEDGDTDSGSEDEDNIDEDDEDYDLEDKGFAAKIGRQAKYLKEKFGDGEDEMSDDDEQDENRKAVWGRKKNLYYSADNIDYELQSSDEDLPMEEEAEVLKIQREKAKSLTMEDFGLEDSVQESDSDGEEKTFQELAKEKAIRQPGVDLVDGITIDGYEVITKDLNALSKEEQMDVVFSSAPELVGLLSELNMTLDQLKQVRPFACKVFREEKDKARGIDYLEVKHILLLTYGQAIIFYLLLKSEGHPVRDHPVIARLVEIKNLWEKMKQLSSKFPQVGDVCSHIFKSTIKSNGENVSFVQQASLVDLSAKASTVPEIVESLKDRSEDLDSKAATKNKQEFQRDLRSIEMLKLRENLEVKLKQKGIFNFVKGEVDKASRHSPRSLETTNDFDDEVAEAAKQHGLHNRHKSLNRIAQAVQRKANGLKVVSGDDDLPKRDDIAERRRRYELKVLARAGVTSTDGEEGNDSPGTHAVDADLQENEDLESEDEHYREVKKQRAEKLSAKAELYSRTHNTPKVEPQADGKRHITSQIEKNRGLTRNRKKLTKNPRRKYKIKHQKAVIRRKGQVRDIRKPSGPYDGEATGININVSRSIRFNR